MYKKFLFVVYTCVPCIADATEIWWAGTYRHFIEYAVDHDSFVYPSAKVEKPFRTADYGTPELSDREDKRDYLLEYMPKDLRTNFVFGEKISGFRN